MTGSPDHTQDRAGLLRPQASADVDLGAVGRNIKALKRLTAAGTRIMAVVKANAYGHGAAPVARAAVTAGADFLAVARISEAVELREAGIDAPLLLFGIPLPEQAPYLATHDIRATIADLETARTLSGHLKSRNLTLSVHIKVDTGMGRLGFVHNSLAPSDDHPVIKDILGIQALRNIRVEGVYSHLACADEADKTHAREQVRRFSLLTEELNAAGTPPYIFHCANSAGLIDLPESHFDMVRPGISIYGLWPSDQMDRSRVSLEPAMSIRSNIIQVKQVPEGFNVSYGGTHVTPRPTAIATVPVGYADGYSRLLSNRGQMLVRGVRAPVVGRVCMDFTMIDVGHIPDAATGDEVVILGRQGKEEITADELARLTRTINYEITAGLTGRIPLHHTEPHLVPNTTH